MDTKNMLEKKENKIINEIKNEKENLTKSNLIKIERKSPLEKSENEKYDYNNNILINFTEIESKPKENNVNKMNFSSDKNNFQFHFNSARTFDKSKSNLINNNENKKENNIKSCFDFENLKEYYKFEKINSNRNFYKSEVENFHNAKTQFFKRFNSFKNLTNNKNFSNRDFYLTKSSEKKTLLCKIEIQNSKKFSPIYNLYDNTTDKFLLTAKKVKFSTISEYLFSIEENDFDKKSENYIGKMSSNILGNKFEIFDYTKDKKDLIINPWIIENIENGNKNMNMNIGIVEYVSNNSYKNILFLLITIRN